MTKEEVIQKQKWYSVSFGALVSDATNLWIGFCRFELNNPFIYDIDDKEKTKIIYEYYCSKKRDIENDYLQYVWE